ncbi:MULTISPECIES: hypothetical protein [unclassified Campylobacter]|uniref:hypothetical protein n=2 Tax=unclassified Campylobacter TaxID=2593542 RepID=UPI001EFA80E1|nr:hypothetical protein [Campylobacter sp. RM12651]MBZ7976200.1 hypothetical protein [Campylobacter sp. RM12637]ULO03221.1 hypothetical protein AVBRAN_0758 [Campylobacter sp. RM12651]
MNINQIINFKFNFKKILYKALFIVFIIIPLLYILIMSLYLLEFNPQKYSKNPEASEKFLTGYLFIDIANTLNIFFKYDSFIVRPFLNIAKNYYDEGKKLLPDDSIEDIMWWVLYYKRMYGLTKKTQDYSMLDKLSYDDYQEIYEMIKRVPYGNIYYDVDIMTEYRLSNMLGLVMLYMSHSPHKRSYEYYIKDYDKASEIYELLNIAFNKYYSYQAEKKFNYALYLEVVIDILRTSAFKYYSENNYYDGTSKIDVTDIPLPDYICNATDTIKINEYFKKAILFTDKSNVYIKNIYDGPVNYLYALHKYCPEDKEIRYRMLNVIVNKFQPMYKKGELNDR